MKRYIIAITLSIFTVDLLWSQDYQQKFEQLGTKLPTPNMYRSASGSPGQAYWQQQADYEISVTLVMSIKP